MRIISYLTKLVFVTTMFLTSVVAQTLTGKVTDNDSGDPLVGAQVLSKEPLMVQPLMLAVHILLM